MKKLFALGFALSAALGLALAQSNVRVGIAFDAGGKNDRSFNQSAWEGAQRAQKEFKIGLFDFELGKSGRASAASPRRASTW